MRVICGVICGIAAIAVLSVGCSSGAPAPTLDGTSWKLVTIQSMDDGQGTTAVPDPRKFTVEFGADGRAAFQIDCNRGNGSFEANPSGTDGSGSLTFGPIATTMMACPPPSLDQKVSTALSFVRGYRLSDHQLHMSMLADGGILTWQPA